MPSREPTPLEIHKALADDTRFRLYRYLGLSGRPVSVRELSTRLSLHPNTLRPHLRRLEEAGLVRREVHQGNRVRVSYELTLKGHSLEPVMGGLRDWARHWHRA